MKPEGAVLLHGYGVRGYIWAPLQTALNNRLGPIATPDLHAESLAALLTKAKARARRQSLERDAPIVVAGHSLGAVLAAITARDLGPDVVSAAVLIAPPFGERTHAPGGLLRLLLRHRLIPPFLLRPRFFSSRTPRSVQRAIFRAAVPEPPGIQNLAFETHWFHTGEFAEPLPQPTLVIASEADRIVPVGQSLDFARVIGARVHVFSMNEGLGHDDLFASPEIAARIADIMVDFVGSI